MFSIIGIPYKHIEQLKFEDFILVKNNIKEKQTSLQVKEINKTLKINNDFKTQYIFKGIKYQSSQ